MLFDDTVQEKPGNPTHSQTGERYGGGGLFTGRQFLTARIAHYHANFAFLAFLDTKAKPSNPKPISA